MLEIIYLSKNGNKKYNTRICEQRTSVKQIFALINNLHCYGEEIQLVKKKKFVYLDTSLYQIF